MDAKPAKKPHEGHRSRLRESYLRGGFEALNEVTRLELLLFYAIPRKDTNLLAHALLKDFGSFSAVMDADLHRLLEVEGMTQNAAILIRLVGQLSAAAQQERIQARSRGILDTTAKCAEYLLPYFFDVNREMVYILCLDGKCKVIACRKLGEGSVNAADVSVRSIVETALHYNASTVIIAHNHPCGIALPSAEDESTTSRIWRALNAVSIPLADHIIIAENEYYSMANAGLFRSFGV